MVNGITYTIKDVCRALGGVSRSRIHTWTQLEPFSDADTLERSARKFNSADLLTLATLQTLEDSFGLRGRQLANFSKKIHQYLAEPKTISTVELIFIRLSDGQILSAHIDNINEPGYIIDIAKERERINIFLGVQPYQTQLPLISSIGVLK